VKLTLDVEYGDDSDDGDFRLAVEGQNAVN
jgi:hypothetical protein